VNNHWTFFPQIYLTAAFKNLVILERMRRSG